MKVLRDTRGKALLPKSGPLPDYPTHEAFVYYYLITGDYKASLLLANYKGVVRPRAHGAERKLWKKKSLQKLLRETVNNLAKLKMRRPTASPESQLGTVENLIATAEEVLIYLTDCMRGEVTEEVLLPRSIGAGEQVIERLRKEVSPRDRTKAAELLAKRYGLLEYKYSIDVNAPVMFKGELELKD